MSNKKVNNKTEQPFVGKDYGFQSFKPAQKPKGGKENGSRNSNNDKPKRNKPKS